MTASGPRPPLAPAEVPSVLIHPSAAHQSNEIGLEPLVLLAAELPDPRSLSPGSWVMVSPGREQKRGVMSRVFGRKPKHSHLAVRCTALLIRGYVNVCADEHGLAFGRSP